MTGQPQPRADIAARPPSSGERAEDVSVVVTAYESPQTLRLVLLALSRQSLLPDEVLVADDGSSAAVRAALRETAAALPFSLVHVWQPHDGFRAARSRNNAIHRASGARLAFLDQDVLPHPDWLAVHMGSLVVGRAGIGFVLDLSEEATRRLTPETVRAGEFARSHEPPALQGLATLHRRYAVYAALRRLGVGLKAKPKLRSCNFSILRSDLQRVNGFSEEYVGWGQEDDDLGRRLYRSGVRPIVLVRRALVSHIPHPARRGPAWEAGSNVERYRAPGWSPRCRFGLSDHPHPDVRVERVR